jgi:hypothetical protein
MEYEDDKGNKYVVRSASSAEFTLEVTQTHEQSARTFEVLRLIGVLPAAPSEAENLDWPAEIPG